MVLVFVLTQDKDILTEARDNKANRVYLTKCESVLSSMQESFVLKAKQISLLRTGLMTCDVYSVQEKSIVCSNPSTSMSFPEYVFKS